MKKITLAVSTLVLLTFYCQNAKADACTFARPGVELNYSVAQGPDTCLLNINLTFEIATNNGNKYIYLHLWKESDYPNLTYASSPNATNLASTVVNLGINNNVDPVQLISSYAPDPAVLLQYNGLTITKIPSTTVGYDRYYIENVTLKIAGSCSDIIKLKGDVWSTQAQGPSSPIHCSNQGFSFTLNDPMLNGIMNCGNPQTYDVEISTTHPDNLNMTYKVYIDDGDHILEEAAGGDQLVYTSPSFIINNTNPFAAYGQTYNYTEAQKDSPIWIVVRNNDATYFNFMEIDNPCPVLPAKLAFFEATSKGNTNQLNWQTLSEQNLSRFEIEKSANGSSFSKVSSVATKTTAGISSQIVDYNTVDNQPFATTFYRLKIVDRDGRMEYSNVVMVKSSKVNKITIFPNPSRGGIFTITGAKLSSFNSSLKVYNASGQQISYTISNINTTIGGATITLKAATRGIYMVEINSSNGRQIERVYVE